MSMVDITLFQSLLKALPLGCRLIMVGDSDQLPSVGAGNVLHDLIESGAVPTATLDEVFRQAMQSTIVANAHRIIGGEYPDLGRRDSDFFFMNNRSPAAAAELICELCSKRLPDAYGYTGDSIQVLCPSRKRDLGTVNLNNALQQRLNPPAEDKCEMPMRGFVLREGDKVMQIKNNYDIEWYRDDGTDGIGAFNGDVGEVYEINRSAELITVRFDDRIATYNSDMFDQLELAYAVTVHKSQGSEFDCVIIPVLDMPEQLRYRNLLYTAVTRARERLILVGSEEAVHQMVDNNKKVLRYTSLDEMLRRYGNG
jgi:exodeoxyribonuclease V alpha subunit